MAAAVGHFLCLQPWLVPITPSTQLLLENSLHFYTILCDSSCRLLFQSQPFEIPLSCPHPNTHQLFVQDNPPVPPSPSLIEHQHSSEFDLELIIAISKENQGQPPCLFMKLNHQLYLANHTAIQELTFPHLSLASQQQQGGGGREEEVEQGHGQGEGLYILMRWSTCSFYITIHRKYKSRKIISDKLSAAILGMNKILKSALPSALLSLAIRKQFQEHYQQSQLKRDEQKQQEQEQRSHEGMLGCAECSSVTVDHHHLTHDTHSAADLIEHMESLAHSPSHVYALDCVETALSHWIDLSSIAQHLLQPVLHSRFYHQMLLSPLEALGSLSQEHASSSQNTSSLNPRKRPFPSPLSPSQTQNQSAAGASLSFSSPPVNKRSKVHLSASTASSAHSEIPYLCLLNLPSDLTSAVDQPPSSSGHPLLRSALQSLSSSLLSLEESDHLEKALHDTLHSMEETLVKSFTDQFMTSRATPPTTTEHETSNPLVKYSQDLETVFASSYLPLIEEISVLRVLPRNDRRPLYPSAPPATSGKQRR